MKYNDLRRLVAFCGGIANLGIDAVSSAILLTTTPEGLRAETSTPEIWARGTLPADINLQGEGLVPGGLLSEVVRAFGAPPDSEVEIAVVDDEIDIRTADGRIHRSLNLLPVGDFRTRERPEMTNRTLVEPDVAEWISKASFAASRDNYAGPLAGVHLHKGGLVATDKYKFCLIEMDWDDIDPVTIPLDLIKHFPTPDSYGDGDIYLTTNNRNASLEFGSLDINGSTLEGEYPNPEQIKSILPTDDRYRFEVPVKTLKGLIGALSPMITALRGATIHPDGIVRVNSDYGRAEDRLIPAADMNLPVPVTIDLAFLRNTVSILRDQETVEFLFHQDKPDTLPFILREGNITIGAMPMRYVV